MNQSTKLPDASEWLTYFPECMDPDSTSGLWICRDVIDVDYVRTNIACVSAQNWEDLRHCREFFERFANIFIAISEPGLCSVVAEKINEYTVGAVVLKANAAAFKGCTTLKEYGGKFGRENLRGVGYGFTELDNPRLLNYAKIERPEKLPTVKSGIKALDRDIGGFRKSELCVWTGKRGEGKTTLVNNLVLEAVDNGARACIYSGELSPAHLRDWHYLQAAGARNVRERRYEETGKSYWHVPTETEAAINEWWDGCIFCFDTRGHGVHEEDTVFSLFEYAWYRHRVSVFVLDNLMTVRIKNERDYFRAQTRFITRLTEFARRREVLVHLIAHPRKTGRDEVQADDVAGIADITNLADNVFRVDRLPDDNDTGADARIRILKNREYGKRGDILLKFEERSRRYSDMDGSGFDRRYSWEPQGFEELPDCEQIPFEH